jgi:hypothetical protein
MLLSQFLPIFANFRRTNWRFSQKPMLYQIFAKASFSLNFLAKIFLKS